jgi:hypothetical protein
MAGTFLYRRVSAFFLFKAMNEKLEEFKNFLNERSKLVGACSDGFRDISEIKTLDDLQRVAMRYFFFACEAKMITPEILEEYDLPLIRVDENVRDACVLVTSEDEPITAYGHSFAVVIGKGKLEAFDNTEILALDESEVDAWDDCLVHAKGHSKVSAKDFSKVYALEDSTVDGGYESYVIQKSPTAKIINSVHFANATNK